MIDALLTPNTAPTFYFIGVTTGQSSAQRVFPRWMEVLGRPEVVLKGIDCQIHDDPARYRQIVEQIKCDAFALGGLITTHKIDLLEAARDLFDQLDPYAQQCDEISCISKRGPQLWGHAVDPVADGRALDAITGPDYFGRTGGEVLVLGAGGAAAALALHLINKQAATERPTHFTFVDVDGLRLARVQQMIDALTPTINFHYLHHTQATQNDQLLTTLPAGSVVINATGLGKDRPGSPLTGAATFPHGGIAWELNYRGALDFMHQALAQQTARQLTVADGWVAFLHGWTGVIAHVLDLEIDPVTFDRLAAVAAAVR